MLASLKLLSPALMPSWRFFASVGPSPRIEFAVRQDPQDDADWRELRPRPARLSAIQTLRRLFWNPDAAERLFLTHCAERLLENPTAHSLREIEARLAADPAPGRRWRIVVIHRDGETLVREIAWPASA